MPTCPTVQVGNQGLRIRLPGGPTIQVSTEATIPTNFQVAKNLIAQANAALAPLAPVFNIIDALLAIKDFAQAVPELVVNPGAVVEAVLALVQKVAKLASLIPQLSVPILILDIIDVVLVALDGIVSQLEAVAAQEARIAAAALRAAEPGNEALVEVVACAEEINIQIRNGIAEGMGPLNSLFGVLNLLLGLVPGGPQIPDFSGISGDTEESIAAVRDLVTVLQNVRSAIPIP